MPALLGLAACAPVTVEQAERSCLGNARDAAGPRSQIGIGVGSGGYTGGYFGFEVSSDYVMGRTPSEAFDRCVRSRSGLPPSRPLEEQPGWSG